MRICADCRGEFSEDVLMYPRLMVSKETRTARRLQGKEETENNEPELLCLSCFINAVEKLPPEQVSAVVVSLMQKIAMLEQQKNRMVFGKPISDKDNRYPGERPPVRPYGENPWVPELPRDYVWTVSSTEDSTSIKKLHDAVSQWATDLP